MKVLSCCLFPLFLTISVLVAMGSCHFIPDTKDLLLQRAERLMGTQPDSALRLLESISESALKEEALARYYLLLTQARDNNYMDLTTDSSIIYSVHYFKEKGDWAQYGKSMYYYGRIIQLCGDELRAMKIYLDAYKSLKDAKEYKLLGLLSENIAIFHRNQSFYDQYIRFVRCAVNFNYLAKDTLGVAYAYQTLGQAFFYKQELDSALECTTRSLQLLKDNPIRLEIAAAKLFAFIYCQKGEYIKAEKILLDIIDKEPNERKKLYHYITLGHLYQKQGKVSEAKKYIMMCMNSPSLSTRSEAYACLSELSEAENNYKEALSYKAIADSLHYLAENQNKREAVVQFQAKYVEEKSLRESLQLQMEKRTIFFSSIILLLFFGICMYYLYRKYYHAKLQITKSCRRLKRNDEKIAGYRKEIKMCKRQKTDSAVSSGNKIKKLNEKIDELMADSHRLRDKLDVSVLIKMLKSGEIIVDNLTLEEWDRIFTLVNNLFNNVLVVLKNKYEQLTDHDIKVLSFLLLSFSSKEVVTLFESKDGHTLSKNKLRIKERIGMLKGEALEDFLQKCRAGKIR